MIYLSIDVGIRNLAYIIYNSTDHKIIDWNIIELCNKEDNSTKMNMIDIGKILYNKFLETFINHKLDIIIIENQIGKNAIRMKTIQGMITMYFINQGYTEIYYWNACNKLKSYGLPSKTTYSERKKYSINITKEQITEKYPEHLEFYMKHKKKDDLADCFLQLIDALNK
jgi:hypothetical protein